MSAPAYQAGILFILCVKQVNYPNDRRKKTRIKRVFFKADNKRAIKPVC